MKKYMSEPKGIFHKMEVSTTVRIEVELVSGEPSIRVVMAGKNEILEFHSVREKVSSLVYGLDSAYTSMGVRVYIEDYNGLVRSLEDWRVL